MPKNDEVPTIGLKSTKITNYFYISREEVQKMVEEADKDGTGLLTEKEFVNSSAAEGMSVSLIIKSLSQFLLPKIPLFDQTGILL